MTTTTPNAIEFREDFRFPDRHDTVTFSASSYQKWADEMLPQCAHLEPCGAAAKVEDTDHIKVGRYVLRRHRFPVTHIVTPGLFDMRRKPYETRTKLSLYASGKKAFCQFDGTVNIPVMFSPEYCLGSFKIWMSLTPMEVASCRIGVRKARGHVLLGGVGQGWMLRRILDRPQVKSVTCVDIDQDVIDFFGKPLVQHPAVQMSKKSLTLKKQNVWETTPDDWEGYDSLIMDVWSSYGTAEYGPKFVRMKKWAGQNNRSVWGWGDVKNLPE